MRSPRPYPVRPNIAPADAERRGFYTVEGLPSVTVRDNTREGKRVLRAVRAMLGPEIDQVTINRDLCCEPHVDHNGGQSYIAFFGKFTGGELCFEDGRCVGGPGGRAV